MPADYVPRDPKIKAALYAWHALFDDVRTAAELVAAIEGFDNVLRRLGFMAVTGSDDAGNE